MNCPVCNTTELSDDTNICPTCQSDLEVFRLIVDANKNREKQKKIVSALSIFAAVTAIGWASAGILRGPSHPVETGPVELSPVISVQNEVRTPKDSEYIAALSEENTLLKSQNQELTSKLTLAPAKPVVKEQANRSGTIIHTVRNGDTFWIIAKKYYNDGRKFKQVASDNGLSVKTKLRKGQKLKIRTNG